MARVGVVYLVKRTEDDHGRLTEPDFGPILGAFSTRPAAEQRREELVQMERLAFHEHGYCVLGQTSLPPEVLGDLVLDLGLEPPSADAADKAEAWDEWFAVNRPLMNGWQRERFIEALDLLGRYSVVELELRG